MSQFYDEAAALALEQITEFGRTVSMVRFTRTVDPIAGEAAASSQNAEPKCIVLPLSKSDKTTLDNRLLEALTAGRLRKLLVAASGLAFAPEPNDWLSFNSSFWMVHGSTPLDPAGTPLLYTLIVEQGTLSDTDQNAFTLPALELAGADFNQLVNETLPSLE